MSHDMTCIRHFKILMCFKIPFRRPIVNYRASLANNQTQTCEYIMMKAAWGSQASNGYFNLLSNFIFFSLFSSKTLILTTFCLFIYIFFSSECWLQADSLGPFDLGLSSSRKIISGENISTSGIVN